MSSQLPLRVLVVDDEAPARRKVLRLLREEGGVDVVGEADGGEAAIAAVRKHSPDVVFLDVQMPDVDGFGVVRSIADAKLPLPRIIFVTAHDKFALRAFEVHAFDYLLKPVSEERFREALRRARRQHEQSTDAFASRLHTDRKSTRLNSSHQIISYAVFCLKKKNELSPGLWGRQADTGGDHVQPFRRDRVRGPQASQQQRHLGADSARQDVSAS